MAKTIKRKFKVRTLSILDELNGQRIVQGFVGIWKTVTQVILIDDSEAFLSVKGLSPRLGLVSMSAA